MVHTTASNAPWWFERGGPTRSHPEHGSDTPQRRRYCPGQQGGKISHAAGGIYSVTSRNRFSLARTPSGVAHGRSGMANVPDRPDCICRTICRLVPLQNYRDRQVSARFHVFTAFGASNLYYRGCAAGFPGYWPRPAGRRRKSGATGPSPQTPSTVQELDYADVQ